MEPIKQDPDYFREYLIQPVLGLTNGLRFDFNFTHEDYGDLVLTDLKNSKAYHGTFKLVFYDGKCNLTIRTEDFEIQFTTGYMRMLNMEFDELIHFLKTGLKGFPEDLR